jgi:hypothetical protein
MMVCLAVMAPIVSAGVTDPNIITGVIHVNSEQTSHPIVVNGGLAEGAKIFVDRDTFFYGDVGAFEGLDYIQTVMNDKTDPDVEYHVVINKPGTLFLFVDNRVGDGEASDPPVLGEGVMNWAVEMGFEVSPFAINFSEPATAYALPVSGDPNVIVLGPQNDGSSRAMYTIAAAPAGWNFPPVIEGVPSSAQVAPGETLEVNAVVIDDGFPEIPGAVEVQWTVEQAPEGATVTFDPDENATEVVISFSHVGEYTLKLSADDGDKVTEKIINVAVKIPEFAIECTDWVEACNDIDKSPSSYYKATKYMYVRNHSAPRRRIQFISYDISELKQPGKTFANSYITLRRHAGHSHAVLSVYGVKEEYEMLDLKGQTWNTLPGLQNMPAPPMSAPITPGTHLDLTELSSLLLEYGPNVPSGNAWSDSPASAGLDEFLNADTNGTVLLMFVTFSEEDADFEIFARGYSDSHPETGLSGIILRGNVMPQTWASNPSPAINSTATQMLSTLSWTNPPAVGELTCNVYIGVGEPNYAEPDYGYDVLATGVTGNSVSLAGYPLEVNTTYNWIVDVYDSGTETLTRGYLWSFTVLDNLAPMVIVTNPVQYVWLNNAGDPASATVVFEAVGEDDGVPGPLTYLWEQIGTEPAEVVIDPNDVDTITLTLPETGTYNFSITVSDGELTATTGAQVFVGATPCEAAQAKLDYVQNPADFNADCFVDLSDFVYFATQWLVCNPAMDAPCH